MEKESPFIRLLQLLNEYIQEVPGRTRTSFERDFGLPNGYLNNSSKQGNSYGNKKLYAPTYVNLHKAQPLLNINWLKTGEGRKWFSDKSGRAEGCSSAKPHAGRPYYGVDFLGGFDEMLNNSAVEPTAYISMEPYNKEGIYWCNLSGESMKPLINPGAQICLRHIAEGVGGIVCGKVYAIVAKNDMRTVKWVTRADDEKNIRLVPENKDPKHGGYVDIPKSDIIMVFKVEYAGNPI